MRNPLVPLLGFAMACGCATTAAERKPRVDTEYDRFKNVTTVHLRGVVLDEEPNFGGTTSQGRLARRLELLAIFSYPGQQPAAVPSVSVGLFSQSRDWNYLRNHGLVLLVDGTPLELGEMRHDGSVVDGGVLEHMWVTVPTPLFRRIVAAGTVEGRLFTTEFRLSPTHMVALRDFAARIPAR